MTESEWLTTTSAVSEMFSVASRKAPGRKLRLIAAAVCRQTWESFPDPRLHDALLISEHFADEVSDDDFDLVVAQKYTAEGMRAVPFGETLSFPDLAYYAVNAAVHSNPIEGLDGCLGIITNWFAEHTSARHRKTALASVRAPACGTFREVIGNPFRPWKSIASFLGGGIVQPDGRTVHLTDAARQLAHGIHVDQAFDRLPILADALEESGITDAALLAHCRNETRHVRGCWALDVALGRV